jgi:hypothetical protein
MSVVEFWENCSLDLDVAQLTEMAVPVKGKSYSNPCRFLEIYANLPQSLPFKTPGPIKDYSHQTIKELFLPKIPGKTVPFGDGIYQPPFIWRDCSAKALGVNFTYTTNAIYRILCNLFELGLIPGNKLDSLLDTGCLLMSSIYKSNHHEIMKNMNNNINMFIISKVMEFLVGKRIYNSEKQEIRLTRRSLAISLAMVKEHINFTIKQQMALALGKGVAFIEKYLNPSILEKRNKTAIYERTYNFYEKELGIDDRQILIDRVWNAYEENRKITMCAILDDATETVDDLLWMQSMLVKFPNFKIHLLVNTAQISINFSIHMLKAIIENPYFSELTARINQQFFIHKTYCPLISFQTNFLTSPANKVIDGVDFVYVKGANFFETCQLVDKDVFYAFVVFGPISQLYTGLNNFDAVFAYVPKGLEGYKHHSNPSRILTLKTITSLGKKVI